MWSSARFSRLEREDGTLVAWYRSVYAPRTGGVYDSHYRTAGIAGRTRRRGGRVAARGTRAAAGTNKTGRNADGFRQRCVGTGQRQGISAGAGAVGLGRGPQRRLRIPLGGGT